MGKEASLQELASLLDAKIVGDNHMVITNVATLQVAKRSEISFLSSKSAAKFLTTTQAGAVVLGEAHAEKYSGNKLLVDDPYVAYAKLSQFFDSRPRRTPGIHSSAIVADSAKIAASASIGANCVVGENVVIGEDCEIYPGVVIAEDAAIGNNCLIYQNVSIYSRVIIGNDAIIHAGAVIGSDGFGFAPSKQGWVKIHQLGTVIVGNKVEIGANTAIDRGALNDTIIHDGVIIDNQVHIAHNVEVDVGTAIAGCVGIAGSTKIGKGCTFGGGTLINGHIEVGDNTHCHGGTLLIKGTPDGGSFASATPQMDLKKWRKTMVRLNQLDDLVQRLKMLEDQQK